MDDPHLYRNTYNLRGYNHAQLLDEFAPRFNWRKDEKDSLLDIGCAGGNVTCELILPKLPKTFSRLTGVDINENMIDYATKNYEIQNVSFEKLDIGGDICKFMFDPFDHITSFICLHLVPDQKLAMQNIYNLLAPNGDCFLHVLADFTGFDMYKRMYTKWSEYMIDIDDFVSPYHLKINPADILRRHLKNAGFKEYNVIERRNAIAYHDVQMFKDAFEPIFPFFSRIPKEKHDEFLDEYVKESMTVFPDAGVKVEKFQTSQNVNIFVSYKFLIAYAKK